MAASIFNISSCSGIVGIPAGAAYTASKAAQLGVIQFTAGHFNANVGCMLGEDEAKTYAVIAVVADISLGSMGTPEDVAYVTLYLASNESKYPTGIELNIDGDIFAGRTAVPTKD